MSSAIETTVLLIALALVVYLVQGYLKHQMRERRERDLLDRLTGEEPTAIVVPVEPGLIERRLRAAGLPGPYEAWVFTISVLATALSVLALSALPALPMAALVAFGFGLYLPWTAVTEWARRRALKFESQLVEAIDAMVASLQAGGNLVQALRSAASSSSEPLRGEFTEVGKRLSLGMPLGRALARVGETFDGEGVRIFTQTLVAKQQAGGDLSPVLRSMNETLRDRARQQRQVQAQLAGARFSAIGVSVLPYVFAPILIWIKPDWFAILQAHPMGSPLLVFAVMLQMVGLLWLWRILSREM